MIPFLIFMFSCDREDLYPDAGLYENVQSTLNDCKKSDIEFLKRTHNIQTAFENCDSNDVQAFTWSPNGEMLYFQLLSGARLLNGESKVLNSIPVNQPTGNAVWLHNGMLVIPQHNPETSKARLAWYQLGGMISHTELPFKEISDLQLGPEENTVLLLGVNDNNEKRPYIISNIKKDPLSAYDNYPGKIDQISRALRADVTTLLQDKTLTVIKSGTTIARISNINRGIVHPDGRYLALEVDGKPLSVIKSTQNRHLSDKQKQRELQRVKQMEESLPDWVEKNITPPEIHIVDLENMGRVRVKRFLGSKFEWYVAKNYYASFFIVGINGELINQNIGLYNLRLDLIEWSKGDIPSSLEKLPKIKLIPDVKQ